MTTATLQLFKDAKFDIYRNMSNFASLSAQNSYYNGLTKIQRSITFNKIGEPFILNDDIAMLSEYTTGRVQYEGMWWYFQILDLAVNAQGRTVITYQLNAWETHRYQGNLKLGAGQITRLGGSLLGSYKDMRIQPPYTPRVKRITDETWRNEQYGYHPCVLAMVRDNAGDWVYPVCKLINDSDGDRYLTNTSAFAHYIQDALADVFENMQIMGMWYSSFCPNVTDWVNTNKNVVYYYDTLNSARDIKDLSGGMFLEGYTDGDTLENDDDVKYYIADERGNVIYRLSDNIEYTGYVDMILNMSLSSCTWECQIYTVEDNVKKSAQSFQLPCEALDFYNDAWATYQATQRQMDIDSRNLQTKSNVVGGVSSAGQSAISGAMTGAMVGSVVPGIGTAVGAIAGLGVSLIGTAVSTLYDTQYKNPKEQAILDRSYKNVQDTYSLCGNGVNGSLMSWGVTAEQYKSYGAGIKKEVYDKGTTAQIHNDLKVYGAYVDIKTSDMEVFLQSGVTLTSASPLQCDVEISGIPANWAGQVQERLQNGVLLSSG